jgi:hypothetical protein
VGTTVTTFLVERACMTSLDVRIRHDAAVVLIQETEEHLKE